jgi:hypothetical protein
MQAPEPGFDIAKRARLEQVLELPDHCIFFFHIGQFVRLGHEAREQITPARMHVI